MCTVIGVMIDKHGYMNLMKAVISKSRWAILQNSYWSFNSTVCLTPRWATPTSMVKQDSLVEQINNYNIVLNSRNSLLRIFNVAISVSPHVCFILDLILNLCF